MRSVSCIKIRACLALLLLQLVKKIITNGKSNINELEHKDDIQQLLSFRKIPLHLYKFMPHSFVIEQIFNMSIATIAPHCAICNLLTKQPPDESWWRDLT